MMNFQVVASVRSFDRVIDVVLAGTLPDGYHRAKMTDFTRTQMQINKKIKKDKELPVKARGYDRNGKDRFRASVGQAIAEGANSFVGAEISMLTKGLLTSSILTAVSRIATVTDAKCQTVLNPTTQACSVTVTVESNVYDTIVVEPPCMRI
jgi:hypothetical protein